MQHARILTVLRTCTLPLLVAAAMLTGRTAAAQCTPAWLPQPVPVTTSIESSGVYGVTAMAVHPSGDVIIGGFGLQSTGLGATGIGRYNPTTGQWSGLGDGLNAYVGAVACTPNGDIYAGGYFPPAGGGQPQSVAVFRQSSQSWQPLGDGVTGVVRALTVAPTGEVYAAETQSPVTRVLKYTPATNSWSVLCAPPFCLDGLFSAEIDAIAAMNNGDVVVHLFNVTSTGANVFRRWSVAAGAWVPFNPSWIRGSVPYDRPGCLVALPNGDLVMSAPNPPNPGPGVIAYFSVSQNAFMPVGLGVNDVVTAMALAPDGSLVASGRFTIAGGNAADSMARYNFTTGQWTALGTGASDPAAIVAPLANGDVIAFGTAGGNDPFMRTGGMMLPDGFARYTAADNRWHSPLGVNGSVTALLRMPDGTAIVGGSFTFAGDIPASNIARYNPATGVWTALGLGTNNAVNALTLLPGGDIVAGGAFTLAGGVGASRVARFSPATGTWSAFGTGNVPTTVYALATLPTGDVVAGGASTTVSRRAVRWSSATNAWSTMGSLGSAGSLGIGHKVLAMAVAANGDVFIGGAFPDPVEGMGNFLHWHAATNTLTAPAFGTDGPVTSLAIAPSGLVALGGEFAVVGSNLQSFYFAAWNPAASAWTAVGYGFDRPVRSLATLSTGDIAVGGDFSTAGGLTGTERIALYHPVGNTWSVLPGNPDYPNAGVRAYPDPGTPSVLALAPLPDAGFLAGGVFSFTVNGAYQPDAVNNFAIFACAGGSDCDSIDFNHDDIFPDTQDITDFLTVFAGGPCSNDPNCGDIDFNNDGLLPDTLDIDALLSVFSGGPCLR